MQLNQIKKKTNKISELNYKISQIRKWSFLSFKSNWIKNNIRFQNRIKRLENDLSNNLHNQLISEFIGEFKNFEIQKNDSNTKKNIITNNLQNKIFFGNQQIGNILGFKIKINFSFGANKKNFANKILNNSLKDIVIKYINQFSKIEFNEIEFEADGKIKWRKNLIGQFCKGSDLLKPIIKVFTDEYFELHKQIIEEKLKNFLLYLIENQMIFLRNFNDTKKSTKFFRALEFSLLENLGHCRKKI